MEEQKKLRTVQEIRDERAILCASMGEHLYQIEFSQQQVKKGIARSSELLKELEEVEKQINQQEKVSA